MPRVVADARIWVLGWTGLRRGRLRDASPASLGISLQGFAPRRGAKILLLLPTTRTLRWPVAIVARVVRRDETLAVAFTSIPRSARPWLRALIETAGSAEPPSPRPAERGQDRRGDRRHYDVHLTALSDRTPHLLVARDLSPEGLRVDLLPWAAPGAELRISFPLPGTSTPIAIAARVARHDGSRGTLLRFDAISSEQRNAIRRLLELLPPLPDGRSEGVTLAEVA